MLSVAPPADNPPRLLSVPPGGVSSAGAEAIDLAESAGLILDPWEAWVLDQALAEDDDGKWNAFEVGLIVSRQNGKTAIIEARLLAGLFLFGEELLIYTAHEFKTAAETFRRIRMMVEATPDLDRSVAKIPESHGEEGIELVTGQRLRVLARSGTSGRGFSGDCLIYDEAMILDSSDAGASVPMCSAREHVTEGGPQIWYSASAGLGKRSTQLAKVRRDGQRGDSKSLFFAEWSIAPHDVYCEPKCAEHDDMDDRAAWARANPGLGFIHTNGTGLTVKALEKERDALDDSAFAAERLGVGVYPTPTDGWVVIPRRWWEATAMTDAVRPAPVVAGIDASPTQRYAAIGLCGPRPDQRMGAELARHDAGTSWLVAEALTIDRRWSPLAWVVDPHGGAGYLIPDLEDAGLNVRKLTATEVGHACGGFYAAIRDDTLRHSNDRDVRRAVAGADRRKLGGQWAWDRADPDLDITPLAAVTFAHWGAVQYATGEYDIGESVHFDLDEIARLCQIGVYGPPDLARLWAEELIDAAGLTELSRRGIPVPPPDALPAR